MCASAQSWPEADEAARRGAAARQDAVWCHLPVVPLLTRRCLLGLIPVSSVAVLPQAERVAEFAAEAAALGGITWVTLVVSGFRALAACVFSRPVTLGVCGFLALAAWVFSGPFTLVVCGFRALAACVFSGPVTLVVCGFRALAACLFSLRGCRRPDVRRRQELRPFGPCLRRFRGRSWPGVRR